LDLKIKTKTTDVSIILSVLWDRLFLVICSMMSVSMVISIGFLLSVQFNLIINNTTTVEEKKNEQGETTIRSKYYDSNKLNSFKIVMGMNFYEWISPIVKLNKVNNGYYYGKFEELYNLGNFLFR